MYTSVNPESVEGQTLLKSHLSSQCFPDVRKKIIQYTNVGDRAYHAHFPAGVVNISHVQQPVSGG